MECVFLSIFMFFSTPLASSLMDAKHVSCSVLRSQEELRERELTCQFHENISESQKHFQVYRLRVNGPTALVVDGTWIGNEPAFYTAQGYENVVLASDKVVIKLPSVQHGDIFSCGLSPVLLERVTTCHVPKKEETPIVNTEYSASRDGVKADCAGTLNEETCYTIIVVLVVIIIFFLAASFRLLYCLQKALGLSRIIMHNEREERNYNE